MKRITVKPGEGLSVQMHHHRAEHWVVVARNGKESLLTVISNCLVKTSPFIFRWGDTLPGKPGKIPLDLIEVRSGSYLEEDDVVRFADRYGRV
ncbi:hypothetical protein OIU92_00780 [Escherichia coli]|nr:hypothetical protein [Escherichia coli]